MIIFIILYLNFKIHIEKNFYYNHNILCDHWITNIYYKILFTKLSKYLLISLIVIKNLICQIKYEIFI